jgi:hypothetical protein
VVLREEIEDLTEVELREEIENLTEVELREKPLKEEKGLLT